MDFIKQALSFFSLVARVRNAHSEVLELLSVQLSSLAAEDIHATLAETGCGDEGEQLAKSLNTLLQRPELRSSYISKVEDTWYPLNIWYLLLAEGESLYRSNRNSLLPSLHTLPTSLHSPEACTSALSAVLWSSLGCLLHHISTRLPGIPLSTPSAGQLWLGIAECPADLFLSGPQCSSIKLLILETIMARGRLACLDGKLCANMQSAMQALAVEDPFKSLPWTQIHKMRKETALTLRKILNKQEVRRVYGYLLSSAERKKEVYRGKVEGYLGRLREAQRLRQNWGMSGVTLKGDVTLIDHPDECNPTLVTGYQVCIALHQFSHFLTKSFPDSPTLQPGLAPENIEQLIDLDRPYARYEERGCQTEKRLFGQVLLALKDQAARVLLEWAESETDRKEFEAKFEEHNGVSAYGINRLRVGVL